MDSNYWRNVAAIQFFALVPYLAVSWGYSALTDESMWTALLVLLVVRFFFSVIELLGGILMWRAYGKKTIVSRWVQALRDGQFPIRTHVGQDIVSYLSDVADDDTQSDDVRLAARLWYQALEIYEQQGVLIGMRMKSAGNAALDAYSQPSLAS